VILKKSYDAFAKASGHKISAQKSIYLRLVG
jgi:hypothetical protein